MRFRPHTWRCSAAIFGAATSAIAAPYQRQFSGALKCHFLDCNQRHCSTNFQAPFRRVEVPFFGATTSAVQALLLGVVQAPFKAHLSHHLSAVQAPLETPFFWAASRRSHAVLKHCRRLHGLDCIQQGCSPRGWRRERRCRCWSSPLGGRKIGSWAWVAGDIKKNKKKWGI